MIQKSMSRKDKSFSQLIQYFEKEQVIDRFSWNLYSNIKNKEELVKEFMQNASYLDQSRGTLFMYHEVLALQENKLSIKRQKEILRELTKQYVQKRANEHLVYGVIHNDTKHLHMHLMISSNKIAQNKRVRLSKKEFAQIQKEVELYKNQVFKNELKQTHFYTQQKTQTREKVQEQEIKYRRKKQTKKEWIKEQLEQNFYRSFSQSALENSLKEQGFELYQKGNTQGISFENKNYRLKTLGLEQEYKQTQTKFIKKEQREEKRSEFKQERNNRKANPRDKTYTQSKNQSSARAR